MPRYLYIFTYQTPEQRAAAGSMPDSAEESSRALFIRADSPEQARAWGAEIAEAFHRTLFADHDVSWKSLHYSHWVETEPEKEYPKDVLVTLPEVDCGAYPDLGKLRG